MIKVQRFKIPENKSPHYSSIPNFKKFVITGSPTKNPPQTMQNPSKTFPATHGTVRSCLS